MAERAVEFIAVPKGTQPARCKGATCGRTDIYWIERRSVAKRFAHLAEHQKPTVRIPVDCAVEGGAEPDSMTDGRGRNHFETCPDSGDF